MAILSSLFGSSQQQPAVGAQQITTTEIPSELKPYYTDILGKAQALYNKRVEEGYKPYEGPTMAQFTPEQQATFTGIAGLQGQVAPKFAEAEELTRQAAAGITGAQLQEAMSPYQQAVTDIEKRESQKAFEQNVLPKLRAAQVAQGSFGGTRGTLLEAQALADQQQGLADIQTKGSAQAFRDARAALEAERTRMGQGATQLANIAPQALKTGLQELGAQQTVGELKQQQSQTALDEAYRQFLQEKQEPYEAMQKYQAVVTGAPLTTTQFAPPPPPAPSLGQQLLGGAVGAAGLYGAFTGQNPLAAVGLMGKKTGGGLSDLPIVKNQMSDDRTIGQRLSGRFKDILNQQGTAFNEFKPFDFLRRRAEAKEDIDNREPGLMEGIDPAREGPQVEDFGGVRQAILRNKARENPYTLGEDDVLGMKDMIGANVKNKKELENIKSVEDTLTGRAATGKFVFPFADPVGPPKGELQKIIEQKEGKGKKDNQGSGTGTQESNVQTKPIGELSDYEKNIRAREDAYLKMLAGTDKRFTDRAAAAEKQGTKDKYMAVAQLGLDIMGTPSSGNLFTTVATSAKNSKVLEKVQAANQRLQKQRDDLEDKAFAAKTGLAKEELGVALNREDRNSIKEAKDAEKKYKSDTLKIAKDELQIKKDELEILKTQSNLETSDYAFIDKQTKSLLDGEYAIGEDGQRKYIGKKGLDPIFQAELDQIEIDAQQALVAAGSVAAYTKTYLPLIKERIESVYQRGTDKAKSSSGNKTVKQELKKNQ